MRLLYLPLAAALLVACATPAILPTSAAAQVIITVGVPPPPLPVYVQPPIPEPGYLWAPGYWDYNDDFGYYWVPGTWILPPRAGLLWTPSYWGFINGVYGFNPGYWGNRVGFYGGIDYGYGYTGSGFYGGEWRGDSFFYNRSVTNITNVTNVTNVYNQQVTVNRSETRVSFNGGQGGLQARPTPQQIAIGREQHIQPTAVQQQHVQIARQDPALRETQNHGRPAVAATARPTAFEGPGVVQAQTAGVRPTGQAIPQGHSAAALGSGAARPGQPGAPSAPPSGVAPGHELPRPSRNGVPAAGPGKPDGRPGQAGASRTVGTANAVLAQPGARPGAPVATPNVVRPGQSAVRSGVTPSKAVRPAVENHAVQEPQNDVAQQRREQPRAESRQQASPRPQQQRVEPRAQQMQRQEARPPQQSQRQAPPPQRRQEARPPKQMQRQAPPPQR